MLRQIWVQAGRDQHIDNSVILLCYCNFGKPEWIALLSLKEKFDKNKMIVIAS